MKTIYLLSPKIKWKTFKMLQNTIIKDDFKPLNGDKILWHMLKNKQIYCWFCDEMPNDMGIGLEIPEHEHLYIINSPSSKTDITEDF